jgi:hypothetical protein
MFIVGNVIGLQLIRHLPYIAQIQVALIPQIAILIALPLVVEYAEEGTAWVVALTLILVLGFCIGALKGVIFGLAALVGPALVSSLLVGIALSGTMVSVIRLFCFFVFPNKDHASRFHSSILYYSITVFLIISACFSLPYFLNSSFMQYHMEKAKLDQAKKHDN